LGAPREARGTRSRGRSAAKEQALVLPQPATEVRWRERLTSPLAIVIYRITFIVAALASWEFVSGRLFPTFAISKPSAILTRLVAYLTSRNGWIDIRLTYQEYLLGLAIGIAAGLFVAILFASVRLLGKIFEPIVSGFNSIPMIALAPLFLILFGIGIWSKVVIAAITVFFIIFFNVYLGIINTPPALADVLRVMGASKFDQLRYAVIPSIAPSLLAGLRLSVAIAMIGVLVGEFVASVRGVGRYIDDQTGLFNTDGTMAGIIVAVSIVLLFRGLLITVERRMMRWSRK
jgi:NitT/TauT family transport system permease protein